MTFFVINSPEIGNEGAHIKYGNKVPCQPRKEINKPLDKLYRKGIAIAHITINGILHKNRIDELKIHLLKPFDIYIILLFTHSAEQFPL